MVTTLDGQVRRLGFIAIALALLVLGAPGDLSPGVAAGNLDDEDAIVEAVDEAPSPEAPMNEPGPEQVVQQSVPEQPAGGNQVEDHGSGILQFESVDELVLLNPVQQTVVLIVNAERARHGLRPLQASARLSHAAQLYAEAMGARSCWGHYCPPVPFISDRVSNAGYRWLEGGDCCGENLAGGQPTPELVMQHWMHSPGHRNNILSPEYEQVGVGAAFNMPGHLKHYWVQVFSMYRGV